MEGRSEGLPEEAASGQHRTEATVTAQPGAQERVRRGGGGVGVGVEG